jgi:hypothetical protein
MTVGEHFWQYGIRCDHEGCTAAIWRIAASEQLAHTQVQADARRGGWAIADDRLHEHRDMCPCHAGKP